MKLLLIRHLWDVTGNREELFSQFRELGLAGIEAALAGVVSLAACSPAPPA